MRTYDKKYERICTISLFLLIPLSGLATDIFLPSFPEMQEVFGTDSKGIQMTLSCFLISYGVSLLAAGSLVDSFGRYKLVLASLVLFSISSFAIALVHNIYFIYGMRIIQGVTTAFIVVGKRAFLVDIYQGKKLQHYMGMLTIIWSMAPISAPFIGGYLQKGFGWTSSFYFLGAYALVMLLIEWFFSGEAFTDLKPFKRKHIAETYRTVLRAPDFSMGLVVLGLTYGMVMSFAMSAPFIVENHFGFSPVVTGYCALISGFGIMSGGILGRSLSTLPFLKKLFFGVGMEILVGLLMFGTGKFVSNIYVFVGFIYLLHLFNGFLYTVYFTYCLTRFPEYAGVTNGLTSGASYLVTSVASYTVVSLLHITNQSGMALSYLLLSLTILSLLFFLRNKVKKRPLARG
ncbi:Predicted arabinose efflux permease, MFS family [Sinomicrobium oceani]|uniref:Predicted arabinose efflux permease, MFS family n=1 Tax=Sinomicrobium oceani TaxID=1150368 RepID=A0A1K1PYT5_9FLAO|nr:MFS transporter [Sinomicrobium oceani]SFW52652.1 Predicted arabinose efflux permease, MFS family [Sinomicrobium oceani]